MGSRPTNHNRNMCCWGPDSRMVPELDALPRFNRSPKSRAAKNPDESMALHTPDHPDLLAPVLPKEQPCFGPSSRPEPLLLITRYVLVLSQRDSLPA